MFRSTLTALLLATALGGTAAAQSAPLPAMSELKTALAAGKQIVIARQLDLTPAEEADFWPVYDNYQRAWANLRERRARLVAQIPDAEPRRLDDIAEDLVDIGIDEARLLDQARSRLRNRIDTAKLVRYLRLEQMIATLERYEQP